MLYAINTKDIVNQTVLAVVGCSFLHSLLFLRGLEKYNS